MDEVSLNRIVEISSIDNISFKETALNPPQLTVTLLVDQQPRAELVRLNLEEASKLLEVHGRVELEVRLDGRVEDGVAHLVHENGRVVVQRVDVQRGVVKVRRRGADELGAGGAEEFLEDGEGFGAAALHTDELLAVLLAEGGVDGVVQTGGVEGHADGDQGVHLVVLLGDSVVAVASLLEVLRPRYVDEDVAEHADGVGIAAHHHVGEPDVVVGGEVGGHDAGKHGLLVHLDVIQGLESQAEIAEQAMDAQQADDREITEHLVKRARAVFSSNGHGVLVPLDRGKLLVNLRPLDKRVEDIENGIASPRVWVLSQKLCLLLVRSLAGDSVPIATERLELVDKFVNHVPSPEVLNTTTKHRQSASTFPETTTNPREPYRRNLQIHGAVRVQDVME